MFYFLRVFIVNVVMNAQERDDSDLLPRVGAVALKLPPFWPESAEVWFAQAEAQFNIKGVSSSTTKFYHCVAAMSQEVASQLLDLIRTPPASEPYEVLKTRLIKSYGLNDYQRFENLVSLPFSGDQKPSHLMNRMLALLPEDYKPGFILRGLFLRRLPSEVRAHLLQEDIRDPRALSLKADELYQSHVSPQVNILSTDDSFESQSVNAVRGLSSSASRSRRSSLSSNVSSAVGPRSASSSSTLCWYHRSHGDKALKCRQPCSWSGN